MTAVVMVQAEEQKLEMASKTSTEFDVRLADMRREMEECRGEAARVKVEASHLTAALRESEATKKSKDRQLNELQQYVDNCYLHRQSRDDHQHDGAVGSLYAMC